MPFVGTCASCGKSGITDLFEEGCANIRRQTNEDWLLEAINPPEENLPGART